MKGSPPYHLRLAKCENTGPAPMLTLRPIVILCLKALGKLNMEVLFGRISSNSPTTTPQRNNIPKRTNAPLYGSE